MTPNFRAFLALFGFAILCLWGVSHSAEYTRDGGTADWMCCADRACTTIISQHADPVRAEKACARLTDQDGVTRYTRSNAFRIYRRSDQAVLRWTQPTQNTDGSALTNLVGYRIHYGVRADALTQTVQVANPTQTTYTIQNLEPGTYYFAVRAYTATNQSDLSNIWGKAVQ